jgi:hypothetical protein
MFVTYKDLVGKKVIAKGTLFAGISAHHHTSVLLTVSTLRIAGRQSVPEYRRFPSARSR